MKKKIIYIDNFLSKHGFAPTIAEVLVKQLRNEGYEIITTSEVKSKLPRLLDMFATIWKHRKNSIALIATYSTNAFYFACACAAFCRKLNIPYIPCLHGGNLPKRIKNSPALAKKIFGKAYTNVAVSGYLQKAMKENNWASIVIPNPVNIELYPFKERITCSPRMLWVRSFHKLYKPTLALDILSKLLLTHKDASLMMIGPDKDGSYNTCLQLAKEMGIENNVGFKGFVTKEEWIKISAGYDFFINTTNFDNLPVSVIEAMALGMVVVSTNVGGLPFLINNNDNGLLLPPDDATAFVNAIDIVLKDNRLANKLSNGARQSALQYGWSNVRVLWNELLQNM